MTGSSGVDEGHWARAPVPGDAVLDLLRFERLAEADSPVVDHSVASNCRPAKMRPFTAICGVPESPTCDAER
jgi:hypothetical protein